MGCKLALEDKGKNKFLKREKHDECKEAKPAKPCSCSSVLSPQQEEPAGSRCKGILVEFLCSCCMLCVCCPLAVICCCIKLPCRMCHKAIKGAWKWACYGSKSRIFAEYSSFSDIDSDVTSGKVKSSVSKDRKDTCK